MGLLASISILLLIWMMIVAGRECLRSCPTSWCLWQIHTRKWLLFVKKSVLHVRLIAQVNCSQTVFTDVFVERPLIPFSMLARLIICICADVISTLPQPPGLSLLVWVLLPLAGMHHWPSGPAHPWEQSAVAPRPCYHSKHLASFGRFVDFCPLVFSLLLL